MLIRAEVRSRIGAMFFQGRGRLPPGRRMPSAQIHMSQPFRGRRDDPHRVTAEVQQFHDFRAAFLHPVEAGKADVVVAALPWLKGTSA